MTARAGVTASALITVITLIVISGCGCAPDTASTWIRAQPQQTLHGLMLSIEERLQAMKRSDERLESLESSVRRLDSTVQDRLDKLERNLNSKELKDELTVEKLTHKIRDVMDSIYDRYNRRLGYTEEKLELILKKMQMTTEASLNRIEKQQEDVQNEVVEAVALLEDIKSQSSATEDKLNHTHKAMQQHIQKLITPSQEELQKISGSLEHLGSRLNGSLAPAGLYGSQNDGPPAIDVVASVRREIGIEGSRITNKINNMYNDLWRRVGSVEGLVKDLGRITNLTHREVLVEVRSLANPENREFPGDSQENFLEVALDALERKLQRRLLDLGRKVEDRLDTFSATQNLVMDSCFDGGICRGLESRLSQVLERIFEVFSGKIEGFSNRTVDLDGLVIEMMELVKTQHSQLIRTVTHNTNMVVTLAKDTGDATKLLHQSVTGLANTSEYNFQDLHKEIQEMLNRSRKVCLDNEKPIEEVVSKQVSPNLLPKTSTEVPVVSSTAEITDPIGFLFSSLQITTERTNKTVKSHDTGVLKITNDFEPLADNSSIASASELHPITVKPSGPLTLDSSILQVIELMSTNLTQNQKDTLLRFLNSTISLDNLEAVIQNTEAEQDYDMSLENYDVDALNKTGADEEFNATKNYKTGTAVSDVSMEVENIPEVNNNELDENEATTTEEVILTYATRHSNNDTEEKANHKHFPKPLEIPEDLKTQLKYYSLIMKIKQGNLNITAFWIPFQQGSNFTDGHNQQTLLPFFKNLCYGEENIQVLALDQANSKMRERLLSINQIVNDKDLYEKIENICNTLTESRSTGGTNENGLQSN